MALNREAMLRHEPADHRASYAKTDTILYALSIGLGADPLDPRQLPFVYEKDLRAFPTMAGVIGWTSPLDNPEFGIDHSRNVLAEMGIALHGTLPAEGHLIAQTRIEDVQDKGKGALIRLRRTLCSEWGEATATVETAVYVRGAGGFGGPAGEKTAAVEMPQRAPDVVCDLPTAPSMALLYRLNGDYNPLHVDPDHARRVGFERPILHGQASYAVAVHALLRAITDYDASRFQSARVRFVQLFFPGETLRTEAWLVDDRITFRARSLERDIVVLDRGVASIKTAR
jgi:acyl dehydratase